MIRLAKSPMLESVHILFAQLEIVKYKHFLPIHLS
jgi:hypothetical protein